MTVREAIATAEQALSEGPVTQDTRDRRWKLIARISDFIETDPEEVWEFVERWSEAADAEVREALATCLLEHILEHWFDRFVPRVEVASRRSTRFASMVLMCWEFGQSKIERNVQRLAALKNELDEPVD